MIASMSRIGSGHEENISCTNSVVAIGNTGNIISSSETNTTIGNVSVQIKHDKSVNFLQYKTDMEFPIL